MNGMRKKCWWVSNVVLPDLDVYCSHHASLSQLCAVIGCDAPHATQYQTCDLPEHRALETAYRKDNGRAIHQLRARLRASGVSVPGDGLTSTMHNIDTSNEPIDDEVIVASTNSPDEIQVTSTQCDGKLTSFSAKSSLKARFGRKRTHNEQLIMRPCGVINSRATLQGSEAISAVKVASIWDYYSRTMLIKAAII